MSDMSGREAATSRQEQAGTAGAVHARRPTDSNGEVTVGTKEIARVFHVSEFT